MAVASCRNRGLRSLPPDGLCRRNCVPSISIRARLAKRCDSQTAMGTSRPLLLQITRGRAVILKDCLLQTQDVFNLSDARERPSSLSGSNDPETSISLCFPPTDDKRHLVSRNCIRTCNSSVRVKIRESIFRKLNQKYYPIIITLICKIFREIILNFFKKTKRLI